METEGQARLGPSNTVSVATGAGPGRILHGDVVLVATGRRPTRPGVGLEEQARRLSG